MKDQAVDLVGLARRAMRERGLEPEFPADVLAQIARLEGPVDDESLVDLRDLAWCSIDNDDSRDLDQLSVAERVPEGTRVRVAIADVDAFVRHGTPIDRHAGFNTTSVYTPMRVFPMLPERLSTDLTSLNPDVDRIAVVLAFDVDRTGTVRDGAVSRALVRNHARLSYDDVAAWLDGHAPAPSPIAAQAGMAAQVQLQDEVATWLRVRRYKEGALDFQNSEAHAIVRDGHVVGLKKDTKDRARALIEDFMIAVNGVSARYLDGRGLASIRRVVRTPKRWDRLQVIATEAGDQLPVEPDPAALSAFLARRRQADPDGYGVLSLAVLKLLGRGEYVLTRPHDINGGHFGLAVREYAHSTAPNRRYPDLVTQRLMKAAATGAEPPYSDEALEALAQHCTRQEDAADKVERQMRKSATALVLSSRVGDVFEGLVTGASGKATWVRTFDPPAEGRIVGGTAGLDVGQRVRVRLTDTDVARGFLDFVLVPVAGVAAT
jgi:VacB/RNase II family 3'-5' exoribonuclease